MLIGLFAVVSIALKGSVTLKAFWTWLGFFGVVSLFNFLLGLCAWGRLNRALKHKQAEQRLSPVSDAQTLSGTETTALPPRRVAMPVTEGTTELLSPREPEQEAVHVKRGRGNTGVIN